MAVGYSLPSRFAFESVRYVSALLSGLPLIGSLRVAVMTGVFLIAKSVCRCYKKTRLYLAGPVFHGFQFQNNLGALEPPLFHVVEHLPDHFADRFNRVADLAAIFHLARGGLDHLMGHILDGLDGAGDTSGGLGLIGRGGKNLRGHGTDVIHGP